MSTRIPVVLVHGALRSRAGLLPTARWLARRGFSPVLFGYRTRRGTLGEHAARLRRRLEAVGLWRPDPAAVGFLTHSMGALVVRAMLRRAHEGGGLPRPVRLAMLSPPNRGASLARRFERSWLARGLYGDALDELHPRAAGGLGPLPPGAAGLVLAGGAGHDRGHNPLLDGDDDGVVAVSDMGLAGTPLVFVGGTHALLQWRPAVLRVASAFLRTGRAPPDGAGAVPGGGLEPPT